MTLLTVLAQIATDPLSGSSGWVGTGMLGAIMAWLLYVHLPAKDKQILGLIESRDKLVEKLTADFRASLDSLLAQGSSKDKELRDDFKMSLQKITDHCEKEVNGTVEALRREVDRISTYVGEMKKSIDERRGG
jgi:uncharacterized protein YicC (UPF0701 family)